MDRQTRRVLLVEDNKSHAALIRFQLAKASCPMDVAWVEDGEAAIEHLKTAATVPHLVLLDLKLPKVDGHDVLKVIKADPRLADIPVVMLTTSENPRDVQACYALGANAYLSKPMDFDRLRHMLLAAAEFWCSWNLTTVA